MESKAWEIIVYMHPMVSNIADMEIILVPNDHVYHPEEIVKHLRKNLSKTTDLFKSDGT